MLTTALLVTPALARGNSLQNSPLPRPAPAARDIQSSPGSRAAPAPHDTPKPDAAAAERRAQTAPAAEGAPKALNPPTGHDLPRTHGVLGGRDGRSAPPSARTGREPLNMVRNAPEELGQVPDHFFWLRQGLQVVQDHAKGGLVFITDEGRIAGRAAMPKGFVVGSIVADDEQVRLLDTSGRRQVSVARNIDASSVKSLQALPVMANRGRRVEVTRRGPDQLTLRGRGRTAHSLDVRSLAGGRLAQAYEIGSRAAESRYVVSEEIVATAPSLKVRVFVRRFDAAGEVTGIVYVPLDGFEVVPHDFIAVDGQGRVRVLAPTASGVKIREYNFIRPPSGPRRLSDTQLKRMGLAVKEISVDTNVTGDASGFRKDDISLKLTAKTPPIARDAILKNARAYLSIDWAMSAANFAKPGIQDRCAPDQARLWRRPLRFTAASIGKTFGPMPYRWGGDDTPETFKARIEWGALAGDVCTCRDATLNYCLVADAAGVDCSGFVSRAWGIEKRGTAGLLDVADEVKSLDDLKPGDAFDWPQRHVRLFIGSPPGAELVFTVLEASTQVDCQGVCESRYRPSELNGYRMIRYRGTDGQRRAAR